MEKVFFTCNRVGTGGAERVITNIANRMSSNGIKVKIICYDVLPGFYYPISDGVEIEEIDKELGNRSSFFLRKIYGLRNLIRLFILLKKEKPDGVISFYTKQNCYSILCCKLLGIPIVCAERDHFFLNDGKQNHVLRKIFYKRADGFIHQTLWAKQYLEEKYKTKKDSIILHNPLWIQNFPERKPNKNEVIAVGRLDTQKNYDGMIRAFSNVVKINRNAVLKIYGDGILRNELEQLIEQLQLKNNIFLMGKVNDVLSAYSEADVFVMFSHGEGYPNALMEAMACGVPCISSDCPVGGPREIIHDKVNGILVPNENEELFTSAILNLLADQERKASFTKESIKIRDTNSMGFIYNQLMDYLHLKFD